MMRYFLLFGVILGLAGCSSLFGKDSVFRDRSSDYLKSAEIPPISVPDGMDSDTLGVTYPVPASGQVADYELPQKFTTPRPDKLGADQGGKVRIQSLDDDKWILVPAPPGQVWPRVRSYLTQNNIPVSQTDADKGMIETSWLPNENDSSMQHQFRFVLQQGVQLDTTEIVVQRRQAAAGALPDPLPAWDAGNGDPKATDTMRLAMANALATDEGAGTASLLGQKIGAAAKVEIVTPKTTDPYLLMKLNFKRSWASVGYALKTDSFQLESSDEDSGLYNVMVVPEKARKQSWWRRIWYGTGGAQGTPYQVHVSKAGDNIEVRITNPDGSPLSQRSAFQMLTLLRANLT